jgi:hypothetical protein
VNTGKTAVLLLLCCIVFSGCIGGGRPQARLREGKSLQDIVLEAEDEFEISMAAPVDERALKELFHILPEDAAEYAGAYSMSFTSADNLLVVRAKPGRGERVRKGLEQRREEVLRNFEASLPEQYRKAEAGKVGSLGDYWFLILLGDPEKDAREEADRAWEMVRANFTA